MPDPVVAPVTPPAPVAPAAPVVPAIAPIAPVTPSDPVTLLDDGPGGGPAAPAATIPADWPTDWREKMSGGNDKALNVLKRFTDPTRVANALLADRQRMSDGKLRAVLPDDATPEQIVQYRKANDIPEKAEAYLEKLPDGLVIGEADKAYVGEFATAMHELNAPANYVHAALKTYYTIQAKQAEALEDKNEATRTEGTEQLIAEWGAEFKGNKNAISNMLAGIPEDARKVLQTARDASGVYLFNQPAILKAFAQIARELNPAGTVVDAADGDIGKSIGDELAQIQTVLRTDPDKYWAKTPEGKKMRDRFTELLSAKERMGGKKVA